MMPTRTMSRQKVVYGVPVVSLRGLNTRLLPYTLAAPRMDVLVICVMPSTYSLQLRLESSVLLRNRVSSEHRYHAASQNTTDELMCWPCSAVRLKKKEEEEQKRREKEEEKREGRIENESMSK